MVDTGPTTKVDPLYGFISKVICSMVVDPTILPPEESKRVAKTFDLNKCLAALASAYPDNYVGDLTDWKDQVEEHVQGDAISFFTPKFRFHTKACTRCNVMMSSWQVQPMWCCTSSA